MSRRDHSALFSEIVILLIPGYAEDLFYIGNTF
jgi:hypothetical protein